MESSSCTAATTVGTCRRRGGAPQAAGTAELASMERRVLQAAHQVGPQHRRGGPANLAAVQGVAERVLGAAGDAGHEGSRCSSCTSPATSTGRQIASNPRRMRD
eukprot:1966419-Pleurochrysis_carterae.AAC.1